MLCRSHSTRQQENAIKFLTIASSCPQEDVRVRCSRNQRIRVPYTIPLYIDPITCMKFFVKICYHLIASSATEHTLYNLVYSAIQYAILYVYSGVA